MDLLNKKNEACGEFRDHLETSGTSPAAATFDEVFSTLPTTLQSHAASCQDCREAAEELLSVRTLLKTLPADSVSPDAWFAARVMAAIAAREAESRGKGSYWAAVPVLASRLALASAALLLVVSSWIYQRPTVAPARTTSTDSAPETLFESSQPPANQDDILVSLAERP